MHAGLVSAFPMFGSSFFYIHSSSSTTFFAPCILAVNQHGLHFLHKNTHVWNHTHAPPCLVLHRCDNVGLVWCRSWWLWSLWRRCSPAAPRGPQLDQVTPTWTSLWETWTHNEWSSCSLSRYKHLTHNEHGHTHQPSQQTCVILSTEPGAVSGYCHAGGKHDVCAGKEAHSATQWNHCVVAHSHTLPNTKKWLCTHTPSDFWAPGDRQVSPPFPFRKSS